VPYDRKPVHGLRPETTGAPAGDPQDIEALKRRFDDLRDEKTKAETRLDVAERTLEELKERAREAYGTDDLEKLKEKLEAMRRENLEKRAAYQASLERIEDELRKVDERYHQAMKEGEEA
jgi:chromosome segregation ATPase